MDTSSSPVFGLLGAAVLIVLSTILVALRVHHQKSVLEERLGFAEAPTIAEVERTRTFTSRVLRPIYVGITGWLGRRTNQSSRDSMAKKFQRAGLHSMSAGAFLFLQALTTSVGFVLGVAADLALAATPPGLFIIPLMGLLGGWVIPRMWVERRGKRRQREIRKSLPDAIDILNLCMRAGQAFEAAMIEVAKPVGQEIQVSGVVEALRQEFVGACTRIQMGQDVADALRGIAENTGVEEVMRLATAVSQAQETGVPIADTLEIQASELRQQRKRAAMAKAQQASLRMLFPMLGCIFPTLFLVLLGPAVIEVMHAMSGGH